MNIRRLKKIKLHNVAITGIPMNEGARTFTTFMKSLSQIGDLEGKPFAGYSNFDDCVRKNNGKSDPEAYCASIMRKVEGGKTLTGGHIMTKETSDPAETAESKSMEAIKKIDDSLKSLSDRIAALEKKNEEGGEDDPENAEEKSKIESLEADMKTLSETMEGIKKSLAEPQNKGIAPTPENEGQISIEDQAKEVKNLCLSGLY
jgi:hypothetical protein